MFLKPRLLLRISRLATTTLHNSHHLQRALPQFVLKSAMSTDAPAKYDWICIMPYHLDAAERRQKCREEHIEGFKPLIAAKIFNLGGPYFDETPAEGEEMTPRGSLMGCVAESKEAVIAILKKDPYTINNVWNWEKARIFPFQCVMRTALE